MNRMKTMLLLLCALPAASPGQLSTLTIQDNAVLRISNGGNAARICADRIDVYGTLHGDNMSAVCTGAVIGCYGTTIPEALCGVTAAGNVVCNPTPRLITASTPQARSSVAVRYLGGASAKVYGFSARFRFDSTIVSTDPTRVTQGDLFSGGTFFEKHADSVSNEIIVDWALMGQSAEGVDGPGTMFNVEFTGISYGLSHIEFLEVIFRDKNNNNIDSVVAQNGAVLVDLSSPTVTDVAIANSSLDWTDDYAKNGDTLVITATVGDTPNYLTADHISADLSSLLAGGDTALRADTYSAGTATWTLAGVTLNADGEKTVTVTARDTVHNAGTGDDAIIADNTKPAAATDLVARPMHQKVRLEWTPGSDAIAYRGVILRYAGWGDLAYPTYPSAGLPAYPGIGTGSLISPVSSVPAPAVTADHEIAVRNIYYYTVFSQDMAGNVQDTPDATATDRSTNYYLGDLGSGTGSIPGSGYDGLVNFDDLLFLSGVYRRPPARWTGNDAEGNFGPAISHKNLGQRFGIPEPDRKIDFEDMMLLAMNYNSVPKSTVPAGPRAQEMALRMHEAREGHDLVVEVELENDGRPVKGASIELRYDPLLLSHVKAESGGVFGDAGASFFHAEKEQGGMVIDAAMLGTGQAAVTSGPVAVLRFEDRSRGAGSVYFGDVKLRDAENREVPLKLKTSSTGASPVAFGIRDVYPNPFSASTEISYGLPEAGEVTLEVYSLLGERVAVLEHGAREAGAHTVRWNGIDASGKAVPGGMYLCILRAGSLTAVRTLTMLH